mmetsp:Transcript_17923/g.32462  ORF Transcript_17923/g.32462 Transcript_17923/m.32462 type:complete len:164 (-) Transcript_17923:200-691(-)|eukprot:CAMPEP_0198282806 /NCGR_PEP_ID=MMETSP1449-20131203/2553_1 /TAXON_ID=420275 /ORGANISM="Attheya septentrionalis, Strain CCMP2084" /LENGTH=163 /DNA_ID=CAMNT_0043979211 /DNA_START=70 /DNA_END=561 /DNA_ORIENTATION=-
MKLSAILVAATVASATAFAPAPIETRPATSLEAEKKSLFKRVAEMDLFAPVATQNNYGARKGKNLKVGTIGDKSYIPAGLTAAQYKKVRDADQGTKDARYAKNVKKAGVFKDYTDFYTKRGTDTKDSWIKSVTRGHDMAKTKYDWSGKTLKDNAAWFTPPGKK